MQKQQKATTSRLSMVMTQKQQIVVSMDAITGLNTTIIVVGPTRKWSTVIKQHKNSKKL